MTQVIFLYNDNFDSEIADIFAYFPDDVCDSQGNKTSYAHIGQHSGCAPEYARQSREATKEEYNSLLSELVSIGYDDLKILNKK